MPDDKPVYESLDSEHVPLAADGDDIIGPVSERPQLPRREDED